MISQKLASLEARIARLENAGKSIRQKSAGFNVADAGEIMDQFIDFVQKTPTVWRKWFAHVKPYGVNGAHGIIKPGLSLNLRCTVHGPQIRFWCQIEDDFNEEVLSPDFTAVVHSEPHQLQHNYNKILQSLQKQVHEFMFENDLL